QEVVRQMLLHLPAASPRDCPCPEALGMALVTERDKIPAETLRALAPIVGKYLGH
ncbi:MAG: S-methyl-5'-thioadenosine phosphorylase, partial [Acidobacteriota bacterium]|nr:S-methyl-5'-thioadenosine phosphorylase [Acidobacteriota bacterium]